jgi:diguanylate cyclase (GGDEF)-like protein
MDEMKRIYREALHARIEALGSAGRLLDEGDEEAADSIRRLAHSLKGSGGTYGFPEISNVAAIVESASDDQLRKSLDELMTVLKEIAAGGQSLAFGILVVEDEPVTARVMQAKLEEPNRIIYTATTGAEAEAILNTEQIHMVLLDLILPDTDGRNFLVKLRERPVFAGLPVIVTSVKGSSSIKAECFALGANEYFEKPVDLEILSAAVGASLQRTGQIVKASRTDTLTGLPNRTAFAEAFQRAQSLAERSRINLSVAILDLDKFKDVNDTYGHNIGDDVLRSFSKILVETLRDTDFVARWGGEEFVVLFPKADAKGAKVALNHTLEVFSKVTFSSEDGHDFQCTFSGGVVDVDKETILEDAVANADRLLYHAKDGGRNQIFTREEPVQDKTISVLLAEDDELVASLISHRLSKEGFEISHYSDGLSALMAAPDMKVDLAILDVKMPGLDGFQLLEKLRKMNHYRAIPIVMLTSMGSDKDISRGFELGADDYIMKPFSPVELLARVNRLMFSR